MTGKIYLILLISYSLSFKSSIARDTGFDLHPTGWNEYIRLSYDNDLFVLSDYYYTQGAGIEVALYDFNTIFPAFLFPRLKTDDDLYGIHAGLYVYTPFLLSAEKILNTDRPYAATLKFDMFRKAYNHDNKFEFFSMVSAGIMGPFSGGKQIQAEIHGLLENTDPAGWDNQLDNSLILNYALAVTKNIYSVSDFLKLDVSGKMNAGTYLNNLSGGLKLSAGDIMQPEFHFMNLVRFPSGFATELYVQPSVTFVAWNTSLQGNIFKKDNAAISSDNLSRIVMDNEVGLSVSFRSVYLNTHINYRSREFRYAEVHRWGGIRIGVKL